MQNDAPADVAPLEQLAARALKHDPARPAIEYEGQWLNWGAVSALAMQIQGLLATAQVGKTQPIALIARNRPSALAALLGLLADRRSILMIYPFQSAQALASEIARIKPAAVIAADQDISPALLSVLKADGSAAIALGAMEARLVAGCETCTIEAEPITEPQIQILTSGTTGPPKRFAIGYDMIARHILGGAKTPAAGQNSAHDPVPALLFMPLGNISGIYTTIPPMISGRRMTLLDRFSLDAWRAFVVQYRPETSGIPPAMMRALLDANIPAEELSSLKFLGLGAAPLDVVLQAEFEERYSIPVMLSYGATEFGGPVSSMTPSDIAQWGFAKRGSVGRALPGARLRVVDAATGAALAPGQEGLLEVVSPRIGPQWLRTADLAMIDADGFLFIRGRVDGAINRGGFKLMPETIERALLLHPGISVAAVVGVSDLRLGEAPAAAIVPKTGSAPLAIAELDEHARRHLPATHIPLHWRIVDDLPKNPSMKIDRQAVKGLFDMQAQTNIAGQA